MVNRWLAPILAFALPCLFPACSSDAPPDACDLLDASSHAGASDDDAGAGPADASPGGGDTSAMDASDGDPDMPDSGSSDAQVAEPDAAIAKPDAGIADPDAAVVEPDAGPVECWGGAVFCDGRCQVENPNACGDSCTMCERPLGGGAECLNSQCTSTCSWGYSVCDAGCCEHPQEYLLSETWVRGLSVAVNARNEPRMAYTSRGYVWYAEWYLNQWEEGAWRVRSVAPTDEGAVPLLQLDSRDRPHIVFKEPEYWADVVRHAELDEQGDWSIESFGLRVDDNYLAFVLDANDRPHVAAANGWDGLAYATKRNGTWQEERFENTKGARHPSLALNAAGQPTLAYYAEDLSRAVLLRQRGDSWQREVLEHAGPGSRPEVRVDAADRVHLILGGPSLRYTFHDGVSWTLQTVDEDSFGPAALELDAAGNAVVAYGAIWVGPPQEKVLRIRRREDGNWVGVGGHEWVNAAQIRLAISAGNDIHVAYNEDYTLDEHLHRVYLADDEWKDELVDATASVGLDMWVKVDASDRVHVAYLNSALDDRNWPSALWYGYLDAAGWHYEMVEASAEGPSLALDAQGRPAISFRSGGDLYLATRVAPWSWSREHVTARAHGSSSLAFGRDGQPRICFSDFWSSDLRLVERNESGWTVSGVDSEGDVGTPCSLALDAEDRPHLSYFDRTHQRIKYAVRDGEWHTSTIDEGTQTTAESAIAIDPGGVPHVVFSDKLNEKVRFARREGAGWQLETLPHPWTGWHVALAFDAQGRPHIASADDSEQRSMDSGLTMSSVRYTTRRNGQWASSLSVGSWDLEGTTLSLAVRPDGRAVIVSRGMRYIDMPK